MNQTKKIQITIIDRYQIKGNQKVKRKKKERIPVVKPGSEGGSGVSAGAGKVRIATLSLSDHRIYYIAGNKYRMHINAPNDYEKVYIQFHAGRDDNKQDAIDIKNVKMEGSPLMDVHGEKLGPISIKEGSNTLYIEFENNEIMAVLPTFTMEVAVNEKHSN